MGEKREPVAWKLTEESTVAMRDDGARLPKYGGANCAQQARQSPLTNTKSVRQRPFIKHSRESNM
jgi:hypothetical protein